MASVPGASVPVERLEPFGEGLEPQTAARECVPIEDAREDRELVNAARQGDRAAFGLLYNRYARMVHGILLARIPVRDVNDLVHDVFLRALHRLHSLRDAARFGAWLAVIARNRANDYHRDAVEEVEFSDEIAGEKAGGAGTTDASDEETTLVLAAIRALPETYRETLLLRLVEGMTGPEIATRTGMTPGSVRVNLHRGMQQLREILGRTAREGSHSGSGDR
jgi:RNA polymerase sigma-70 factor, ECF subfamily